MNVCDSLYKKQFPLPGKSILPLLRQNNMKLNS